VEDKKEEERLRKAKEVESAEAAIRKQEMEATKAKKNTLFLLGNLP